MISGIKSDAQALREQIAEVLSTVGLRLSPEKTLITHIDEGLDFLGFRVQRHQKKGAAKRYVHTYPHRAALATVKAKVRALTQGNAHLPLAVLLHRLNQVQRAGPPTSGTRPRQRPSPTSARLPGAGSGSGCGTNTTSATGRNCVGSMRPQAC